MRRMGRIRTMVDGNSLKALVITCVLLCAYQLIGVFAGFELCDSGFYLTFYEHIFDAPQCVEYNFMYYLAGLTGGAFLQLFPSSGLLGIRLLGLFCNLLCICLVYRVYIGRIPASAVLLGMSLTVISYVPMQMAFYHDLQTCLLFVIAVVLLVEGLEESSRWLLFLGGFVIGLNVFVRLPNLLDYCVVTVIVVHGLLYKGAFRRYAGYCALFSAGFACGIAGVLLLMKGLGHYPYFVNVLKELVSMGSDNSGNNSHGLLTMLAGYMHKYRLIVLLAGKSLILYAVVLVPAFFIRRCRRLVLPLSFSVALAGLAYVIVRSEIMTVLYAFCLVGTLGGLFFLKDNAVRLLSYCGLLMMLVVPLGSDYLYNNGSVIFWLALPVSVAFFYHLPGYAEKKGWHVPVRMLLVSTVVIYALSCGARMVQEGCYFDEGFFLSKRHAIRSEKTKCIYTSKERAEVVNDLLEGVRPYLKEGDCLFAYGSIPMLNYLTGTKPFLGCSWPEQFSARTLKRKLEGYEGKKPMVLRQKFNSIGNGAWKADADYLTDCGKESGTLCTNEKNRIIDRYIRMNGYRAVFENDYFVLYIP